MMGIGNGGFSLRKVKSCLRAMRLSADPRRSFLAARRRARPGDAPWEIFRRVLIFWQCRASSYQLNEDQFWSDAAPFYDPDFRVPTPEIGVQFAFETGPRNCFEITGRKLPFGCHAWARYDREFWKPYLLPTPDSHASP